MFEPTESEGAFDGGYELQAGRRVNYARLQQYRRLPHAGKAALGSVVIGLLGFAVVIAGAATLGGLLVLTAVGLGLRRDRESPALLTSSMANNLATFSSSSRSSLASPGAPAVPTKRRPARAATQSRSAYLCPSWTLPTRKHRLRLSMAAGAWRVDANRLGYARSRAQFPLGVRTSYLLLSRGPASRPLGDSLSVAYASIRSRVLRTACSNV